MAVKMTYDAEVDALYIQLRDAPIEDSVDYEEGVTVDLAKNGEVIGVEILDARSHLDDESEWTQLARRNANVA